MINFLKVVYLIILRFLINIIRYIITDKVKENTIIEGSRKSFKFYFNYEAHTFFKD